ncbi:MAG: hypothetical protein N2Z79_05095 [Candidatus Omnitrophica bacterium]|nr:hypothetical protein [Candidatus Omnitrophota bacterium]
MKENILPEEKLLRLIRGDKKIKLGGEKSSPHNFISLSFILNKLNFKIKAQQIRSLLYILLFISSSYFFISLFWPLVFNPSVKKTPLFGNVSFELEAKFPPYEYYQEKINRDIFKPYSYSKEISERSQKANLADVELIKDLTLLGIISGEPNQAIIEDKRNNKTYFLKEGEFLGELQVKSIKEGRVILEYRGREIDLFL